jgi:hypothetical protein
MNKQFLGLALLAGSLCASLSPALADEIIMPGYAGTQTMVYPGSSYVVNPYAAAPVVTTTPVYTEKIKVHHHHYRVVRGENFGPYYDGNTGFSYWY